MTVTHPERVLFADIGLTKGELAAYYESIAKDILPHIANRPLSMVRCPEGIEGACFFQKHASPGMSEALVHRAPNEADAFVTIGDVDGLIQLVQFGAIEFHVWGCRLPALEKPDLMVFDLDPGPGVEWPTVVESTLVLGELLRSFKLTPFVKTSGGKGFHLCVPLKGGSVSWDQMKDLTRAIAEDLDRRIPGKFVVNMAKAKRHGRIFVDYLRNGRGATSVAPYSVRARPGAPVSVPVPWSAVSGLKSGMEFSVRNLAEWRNTSGKSEWAKFEATESNVTAQLLLELGVE